VIRTELDEVREALVSLGVGSGATICLHSRLATIGRVMCERPVEAIGEVILDLLGAAGTVFVPTYTFGEREVFDPLSSSTTESGVVSEYFRGLPSAVRSLSPTHSHVGLGAQAARLPLERVRRPFGDPSDFSDFLELDARLVLLGCSFADGATFLHHMEAVVGVPYREWVRLTRKVVVGGRTTDVEFDYYARSNPSVSEDFDRILPFLREQGVLTQIRIGYASSFSVALSDLARCVQELLANDPLALVR